MLESAPRKVVYNRKYKALPKSSQGKNSGIPKYGGLVERIQEILGAKNQNEVAEMLGVKPASVSGWKKEGFVSVDTLLKIANLSNASINWLLTGEGSKHIADFSEQVVAQKKPTDQLSVKIQALLNDCIKLNAKDKEFILHHVEILHHTANEYLEKYKSRNIRPVLSMGKIDMADLVDRLREDYPDIKAKQIYRVVDNIKLEEVDPTIISIVRKYAGIPEDGKDSQIEVLKNGS